MTRDVKQLTLKRLPFNSKGRDFVCGDIHGSYSCVMQFLEKIGFDKSADRLICAGDLIDRGPENEKCLELLFEPWFFCTLGNHEQMMMQYFDDEAPGILMWAANGGQWGLEYKTQLSDMGVMVRGVVEDVFPKLPYILTVEKEDKSAAFHVMHAELKSAEPITDADFEDEDIARFLSTQQSFDGNTVLWGRWRFYRFYKATATDDMIRKAKVESQLNKDRMFSDKLSMIYSGHTPLKQPIQFYGQTNLDTMAYGSYLTDNYGNPEYPWAGLTVTEPATGKFWKVNDRSFEEVSPIMISQEN